MGIGTGQASALTLPDGPRARYQRLLESRQLTPDPAQAAVLEQLQHRFELLLQRRRRRWLRRRERLPQAGLYIHGQVGRGKTMLMDLFATSLSQAGVSVWRIHFHRFMDEIHARLKADGRHQDPLRRVAADIARVTRVLCLDEFHVSDIGDAMILGELLIQLFAREVVLVTTSNTEPDKLYADGLQRARFLPAIAAIRAHCEVIDLAAEDDYRLRELVRHPVYYCPNNDAARAQLGREFQALAAGEVVSDQSLDLRGHLIKPCCRAGTVAWFDFATLCEGPRASADYIELARRFGTLIISEVRQMSDGDNDAARRFIHLVDECYDRAVKLIITANVPPEALYTGKRLAAPFERTASRLIEMQSRDYLALPHRPE